MQTLNNLTSLKGQKVLLRADFDVPISDGKIYESFRIKKQKKTIDYLLNKGARVLIIAHVSDIDSFEPLLSQLDNILGRKIVCIKDYKKIESEFSHSPDENLFLLDNVRKWDGEKENDEAFAKELAEGFDVYINNAFAVSHRAHASVSAITDILSSYAGLIIEDEIANLSKALEYPSEGKIFIMGGAKASTKIPVIKNFIDRSEKVLIGGVIANDILKKQGVDINGSKFDEDFNELLSGLNIADPRIVMPSDYNIFEGKYLDIGSKSVSNFREIILNAKIIIWNGPMGMFEDGRFANGTDGVAQAVVDSQAFKIIGGGDTISAVDKFGLDKFDFVSTGGGAMLTFLSGEKLPGLDALDYYGK